MRLQFKDILPPFIITILILIVLEIVTTAFLPVMGMTEYRLTFYTLIVLFMGFKLETPYLPLLILTLSFIHSFFSIEGWAMGTLAGVLVCLIISYLRDLIHFSSIGLTIFVTQVFQVIWFLLVSFMVYMQGAEFSYLVETFWRFVPESIFLSILAPFFFSILDKIWKRAGEGVLGGNA